jgi:hypothetical protein
MGEIDKNLTIYFYKFNYSSFNFHVTVLNGQKEYHPNGDSRDTKTRDLLFNPFLFHSII